MNTPKPDSGDKQDKPSKPHRGLSLGVPRIPTGGLIGQSRSPMDAAGQDPATAAALDAWAREPAERVAASINSIPLQKVEEAVKTVLTEVASPAPAQPEENAPAASQEVSEPLENDQQADGDDEAMFSMAYSPVNVGRRRTGPLQPWTAQAKQIQSKRGSAGQPANFKLSAELYAKAWFLKGITPGMTWDKLGEAAVERFVNRKLKELGYDV